MADILPFKKPTEPISNTEPIIHSDYWGDTFPLLELLDAVEKLKDKNKEENKQ